MKSNSLSILADNSIQDPIIGNIQPCIISDVIGIKSNKVNSSAYDSIQDPKSECKSDSKSNSIKQQKQRKQQQIKKLSNQMRAKKTLSKSDFIKHQIKGLSELTTKKDISNKASLKIQLSSNNSNIELNLIINKD